MDEGSSRSEDIMAALVARLERVEAQLVEFHRRSAHREAIIDRLHDENQRLRGDLRQTVLYPVVADLVRLYDALSSAAAAAERAGDGSSAAADLIRSFAGDIELALDRCGIEPFDGAPGEPYRPGDHRPLGVVATDLPELDNTIAEVLAPGFREREGGRVRRQLHARVARYQPAAEPVATPPATQPA